jgi:hypothetical protein
MVNNDDEIKNSFRKWLESKNIHLIDHLENDILSFINQTLKEKDETPLLARTLDRLNRVMLILEKPKNPDVHEILSCIVDDIINNSNMKNNKDIL